MNRLLSSSAVLAVIVVVAISGWMLTGSGLPSQRSATSSGVVRSPSIDASENARPLPLKSMSADAARLRVLVVDSQATIVDREVVVSARTEPDRNVQLRSEVEGRVVELNAERGVKVAENQPVARIDIRDLNARLAEAEALLNQHQIQYEAAMQLRSDNLMSESQIAEARARLAASEATLTNIRLDIANTQIRAPFDAFVQERPVEIGDFVQVGDVVAELVDTDPLIIVGEISEREISDLDVGAIGYAELVSGMRVEGTVRYIAPVANEGTRTFRVELAVPNPDGAFRAGMTAELSVATEAVIGHLLSPSLLTLDDNGTIGIKSVDSRNRVEFRPVEILRSSDEGVWVAGLPDRVRIITVGQGFVTAGEEVEPVRSFDK